MSFIPIIKKLQKNLLNKKIILLGISLVALFFIGLAYLYIEKINLTISNQAAKEVTATRIESSVKVLAPITSGGIRLSVDSLESRAICEYNDNYYVATAGGLLELDKEGKLLNHYTILDGLPSINILCLSVFRSQLYIGTADNGLVAFNGKDFTHYKIEKPSIKQINTLLATNENLLVGSFDGGLLSFDGTKFTRRDQAIKAISQITALLEHENRLYVGTYSSGLYVWQESQWLEIRKEQGLPSNRVTALIADSRGTIISTDFGVVLRATNGELEQVSTKANISSLVYFKENLFGGLLTGGLVGLLSKTASTNNISIKEIGESKLSKLSSLSSNSEGLWKKNTILWVSKDNVMFALTRQGIFREQNSQTGLEFEPFGASSSLSPLRASHISSMAFDERGRLWIGYFDQGIDIFDTINMQLITHLEDQIIREINFISLDKSSSRILVATSSGLAIFDNQLQYRVLSEQDGLNSNLVAHVSILTNPSTNDLELAIATGRGLTFVKGNSFRSPISLPNNYLYSTAINNDQLYVGSLGGLIEMDGLRVKRSFTISNSKLSHNWINALLTINGTLYIGTNGGGVDALTPTGELINFSPQIGKFDVNPNAMYSDDDYLYVGSLDQGVFLLDLKSKIWRKYAQILPSTNVTAILSNKEYVYFATTNGLIRIDRKIVLGN
ncbi:MAG: hypothetical protein HY819_01240 [Acidobacteria bacterium]|nr:hypothetical protein [Acidobacteriota bacterium]